MLAITLPDAIILLEFNVILPAPVIPTLPVDESVPAPAPTAINVFAIKLPLAITFVELILTAPAAVRVMFPVDEIKPADALADIKPFAITLPALILPVYVGKYAAIFALLNEDDAVGAAQNKLPVPFVCSIYPFTPSVCGHACPSNTILPRPVAVNSMFEFAPVTTDKEPVVSIIPPVTIKLPAVRLPV